MNTFLLICQYDLKQSFRSLRWVLAAFFFLLFMGAFFFHFVDSFIALQQSRHGTGEHLPDISGLVSSLFGVLHFILVLLIPAVTMDAFAGDGKRGGALKFLLPMPVSGYSVVLGKFLAVSILIFLIFAMSLVYPLYLTVYAQLSGGQIAQIASCYLGLTLLACSQSAFGLWISALCKHQFSAFIITMSGLFLMLVANILSSSIKGWHWTHQIIRYLGASGHLSSFFSGILTVSDIVYFSGFGALFLFFTILSFDAYRWS